MWTGALWHTLQTIGIADLLDIAAVSFIIYGVLLWFEWTKAAFVARGILILATLYVLARQMGMVLTTWLFHGFFAIIVVALVIIFQEELRRFFEHLATWSWRPERNNAPFQVPMVSLLAHSLITHARAKVGALIVLKGREPLERHIEGGHLLDGEISGPILQSIFDVHSDGHDGAVLIEGSRIRRFAVHLPLSRNFDRLSSRGTRHAAALGLSEVCDALCLVVSEEKGTISAARRGQWIEVIKEEEVERLIQEHLASVDVPAHQSRWRTYFASHLSEKILAVAISFGLWLMFVHGFKPETKTFRVPVTVQNVPPGLQVKAIIPMKVGLTLSGLKRDIDVLDPSRLKAYVNLENQGVGRGHETIFEENLRIPPSFRFLAADPASVEVHLEPVAKTPQ